MNKEQLEQKKKEAIAHNVSESQSILIHDLASRMFDAGVEAMQEEVKRLERELKEWSKYED